MSQNLPNMLESTIAKIREMVDVNSVIGEPITAGGVTIIPISKVSVGFGGGGSDYVSRNLNKQENPFGGGAGGGINHNVWIELCNVDGTVIARFYNDAEGKQNTRMNAYYYQYAGETVDCFIRIVDNANSDYGGFVVDAFKVSESAPEGYLPAFQ